MLKALRSLLIAAFFVLSGMGSAATTIELITPLTKSDTVTSNGIPITQQLLQGQNVAVDVGDGVTMTVNGTTIINKIREFASYRGVAGYCDLVVISLAPCRLNGNDPKTATTADHRAGRGTAVVWRYDNGTCYYDDANAFGSFDWTYIDSGGNVPAHGTNAKPAQADVECSKFGGWPEDYPLWRNPNSNMYGFPLWTGALWNQYMVAYIGQMFTNDKPNVTGLERYGITFNKPLKDDGYEASTPTTGDGGTTPTTGGGSSTCTTSSGGTSTNQYDCAPKDAGTSCTVLDIACNLRKLFIPEPDYFKKTLNSDALSEKLHLPIREISHWDIQLKFIGTDVQTIPIYFDDIFTQEARDMLIYLERICIFFWVLNVLGLPNPFGRSLGGADESIRIAAAQYRNARHYSGNLGGEADHFI